MKKKILVITGSPRSDGNTNTLVKAFSTAAMSVGHEVQFLDAAKCNLSPCHADNSCLESGRCPLNDSGMKLQEMMCWADVLVLASPVYWGSFTSQMKTFIDRLHPFCGKKARAACTVKETYLIATAQTAEMDVFSIMREEFAYINHVLDFKIAGELLVPGVNEPDDLIQKSDCLEKAVKMGLSI